MPSSKNESILLGKGFLSITHAARDETLPLRLEFKKDESIYKNANVLCKDEENSNQRRPGQIILDNSKSQDQLKSSWTPLNFASTSEGNAATILKSQTSRSSYAYEASISSIDDASIDHFIKKNHLMSRRTQRPSKFVSNISKEGEEDNAQAESQFNKIPLKSRANSNEIALEGNDYTNVRHNIHRKRASVESLPFSSRVEFEMNQRSHLREPTFISNALRSQKQDRIELSFGHHQCLSHPSHSFCHRSSVCSSCAYDIHHSSLIEEVKKLKMKSKRLMARRQCRPFSNGAPFVICGQCFELLRLPMDFFVSKRGSNKLQCGACSKVLVVQFPAKSCLQVVQPSLAAGNASLKGNSSQVRNREQELITPLHQLMGYFSATEVLYQVTDVDEGYESSEPAMPDSYRRYEEERHENSLLRYSGDEACVGCVEVEEDDSSKISNKREQSRLRVLMNGVRRMDTWGLKA